MAPAQTLHRLYVALGLVLLVAPGTVLVPTEPATAAPACSTAAQPQPAIAELPWAQRWFQFERIWPIATGRGVRVAVIDSGVDATHAQLRDGQVLAGMDMLTNTAGGNVDCDSHGTAVASLIAASASQGVGFAGLAHHASILPIRVSERNTESSTTEESPVDPALFARAVRWAADQGARVINVSVVFYVDHAVVRDAVRYARGRGSVIVAAVGNHHGPQAPLDRPTYPAAYLGVVGVGAIAADGTRLPASAVGPYVDLVAPGDEVTAAVRRAGHARWSGTSFAAPFVSAAAALLLSAAADMSSDQVVQRLYATADPPAGAPDGYGHGVVNPYRALTEGLSGTTEPAWVPGAPDPTVDPLAQARERRWQDDGRLATMATVGAVGLAVVAVLAMVVRVRGRRSGWSPTRLGSSPEPSTVYVDDPERVFFTVPAPGGGASATDNADPAAVRQRGQ